MKVNFRILIQKDPEDHRSWIELTNNGLVPALPPIGSLVFIKGSNLDFMVNRILMTAVRVSEPEENDQNIVTLIQINPATSKMEPADYEMICDKYMAKGWVIGDLADNMRRALFGK